MHIKSIEEIEKLMPENYIPREIESTLMPDVKKPEILVIYGARQIGKSSLLYSIMKKVYKESPTIFYYNLDIIPEEFNDADLFLEDIMSKSQKGKQIYVFLDEIQRKPDIGLFLKYIYDKKENIKFIATGSSSLQIKNIIREPLTGRKFEYMLMPLSLKEIFAWKKIQTSKLSKNTPDVEKIIDDYMIYGGYPAVIQLTSQDDKSKKLYEIANSYITRDLVEIFGINSPEDLRKVAIFCAENIGNLLSKENIAKMLSISVYAVESYLEALRKTFIISLVYPFYKNPIKEIAHRPKVYFIDNGIRNAVLKKLEHNFISGDKGKLFEQVVFQTLQSSTGELNYWRTKNQTEVDFVYNEGEKITAWEVKNNWGKKEKPRNLKSFETTYKAKTYVVDRDNILKFV